MRKKSGFTLIELLVVIAIIAILAAILFPVFAKAREKARQTACLSNLKQLGLGLMMYVEDYDETMPAGVTTSGTISNWQNEIYPYVNNGGIFGCPDGSSSTTATINGVVVKSSYAVNGAVCGVNEGVALASFVEPAGTILLCDSQVPTIFTATYGNTIIPDASAVTNIDKPFSDTLGSGNPPTNGVLNFIHSAGMNIAFGDGHAKWMQWGAVAAQPFTPATDATDYLWYPSGAAPW